MLAILLIDFFASWYENAWIINSMSSPTLILVLDISYDLLTWKMCLCYLT